MWLWLESTSLIASVCSLFSDQMQESGTMESQQETQIALKFARRRKTLFIHFHEQFTGEKLGIIKLASLLRVKSVSSAASSCSGAGA